MRGLVLLGRHRHRVGGPGGAVVDGEPLAVGHDLGVAGLGLQLEPRAAVAGQPQAALGAGASGESAPCGSEPDGSRPLVNVTRALTPSTGGAVMASWTARSSGFGSGFASEPLIAACASAPVSASATSAAKIATRRWVEVVRSRLMGRRSFGQMVTGRIAHITVRAGIRSRRRVEALVVGVDDRGASQTSTPRSTRSRTALRRSGSGRREAGARSAPGGRRRGQRSRRPARCRPGRRRRPRTAATRRRRSRRRASALA